MRLKPSTLKRKLAWTVAWMALGTFMVAHGARQTLTLACVAACLDPPLAARAQSMRSPIAWALVLAALVIHSVKALREALSSSSGGRPWTLRALVTGAGVGALGFVLLHAAQLRVLRSRQPSTALRFKRRWRPPHRRRRSSPLRPRVSRRRGLRLLLGLWRARADRQG